MATPAQGWAFRLGELALVASLPDVEAELRGQIVEITRMPQLSNFGNKEMWAYQVSHSGQLYLATQSALRKLPPPGTRPSDSEYDGNKPAEFDTAIWQPKDIQCLSS